MGQWREIAGGHLLQLYPDGGGRVSLVWEHGCLPGYSVPQHQVSSTGPHWMVLSEEPLTLSPSLHCDPGRGGCGLHGFVRNGSWEGPPSAMLSADQTIIREASSMTVEQDPPAFDPQKRADQIAEHGEELSGSQPISPATAPPEVPADEDGGDQGTGDQGTGEEEPLP